MTQILSCLRVLAVGSLAALILSVSLACNEEEGSDSKLQVVTTLSVFADFARQIGGDRVEIFTLFPAGSDPHTFEPAPRDVQRIAKADLVFANGLGLEPAALRIIEPNLASDGSLVAMAEDAEKAGVSIIPFAFKEHEEGDGHGNEDPHLWLSVANSKEYARIMRDRFSEVDPAGAVEYAQNYDRYAAELDELDRYARGKAASVPPDRRKLVTAHDAFGYLARDLGLQVAGFVVPSPGQEPSPSDIANLAKTLRDQRVPAVFVEPQLGAEARVLQRAASDAGVKLCTLYSDALDSKVHTYADLIRFNADEIARCLGGDANG